MYHDEGLQPETPQYIAFHNLDSVHQVNINLKKDKYDLGLNVDDLQMEIKNMSKTLK